MPTKFRLSSGIRGISYSSLWAAWKEIRKVLKRSSQRDVVDFIDYDIDPDTWINRLLLELQSGVYEPRRPERFPQGKSKGFSRTLTLPAVPDLVLYRAIIDHCYERGLKARRQRKHVYFEVAELKRIQDRAAD